MSKETLKIYTKEELIQMYDEWKFFIGFSGETCPECKKTHNIILGWAGWFCCNCGAYNSLDMDKYHEIHENPDYGTPASVITEAWRESKKYENMMRIINEDNTKTS